MTATRCSILEPLETRLLMARVKGLDVSQFQDTMNFTTAYNAGDRFVFHRASRTDTVPDIDVHQNVPNAKAAGMLVGVYHRIFPLGNAEDTGELVDPITDANNFFASGGAYMGEGYMRPVVDVEDGASLNGSAAHGGYTLSSWVNAFVDHIEALTGGITPLIYCNTNYASNYLNSSVANNAPDLWIANWTTSTYGDPVNGNGSPPLGVWASKGWDFWQYTSNGVGSQHGATSARIDLDVFNGDDINVIKQNFVTGAPKIPSGPSPASGATGVSPHSVLLNWNDSQGATRYDVWLNGVKVASNITVSQYNIGDVAGGTHSWKVVAKGPSNDDDTWVENNIAWTFTANAMPLPGTPTVVWPAMNQLVNTKPLTLDWADSPNATSYDIYLGSSGTPTATNLTSSQYGPIGPSDGVRLWRVVAKNASGNTSGPQWQYTMDTTPPTASLQTPQPPAHGSAFVDFTVTYSDVNGIDVSSLDDGDITVSGPNGYSAGADFISAAGNVATYRMAAPGGTWDSGDNGTYTVSQNADEVRDNAGNARAAGAIGTFDPFVPFAYVVGTTLHVEFGAPGITSMFPDGADITVFQGYGLDFGSASFDNVVVHGSSGSDQLQAAGFSQPVSFAGSSGNDVLMVEGGVLTLGADAGPGTSLGVFVGTGAHLMLNTSQHLRHLTMQANCTVTLAAGGDKVLVVNGGLSDDGRIDLKDNDLIWNYNASTPLGSWNGTAYTGALGMVESGRGDGSWNGASGVITSMTDATTSLLTGIAVAEAASLFDLGASETAVFSGETVDATSIVFKYTWGGDADMDGDLDGDDYFQIDSFVAQSGSVFGYSVGDFDYDGDIDGDDYFIIDSNLSAAQGLLL